MKLYLADGNECATNPHRSDRKPQNYGQAASRQRSQIGNKCIQVGGRDSLIPLGRHRGHETRSIRANALRDRSFDVVVAPFADPNDRVGGDVPAYHGLRHIGIIRQLSTTRVKTAPVERSPILAENRVTAIVVCNRPGEIRPVSNLVLAWRCSMRSTGRSWAASGFLNCVRATG